MANTPARRPSPGRPSKFNGERAERLLLAVRNGNDLKVAAAYAGVSYTTFHRWLLKADDPDAAPEYVEFKAAIEKAQADAEVSALAVIRKSAQDGNSDAAKWYLERAYPQRWAKRDISRLEITGDGGGPVKIVAGMELTPESMTALAQRLSTRPAPEEDDDIIDAELVEDDDNYDPWDHGDPLDPLEDL